MKVRLAGNNINQTMDRVILELLTENLKYAFLMRKLVTNLLHERKLKLIYNQLSAPLKTLYHSLWFLLVQILLGLCQ